MEKNYLETMFADSSDEDEAFLGFDEGGYGSDISEAFSEEGSDVEDDDERIDAERNGEADDEWNSVCKEYTSFVEFCGPTLDATFELQNEHNELDFLNKIFVPEICELIARETNRYVLRKRHPPHVEDKNWEPTTSDEIKQYFGIRVAMSIIDLPRTKMYWITDEMFGNLSISNIMPRNRFDKLSEYLHAANNFELDGATRRD